MAKTIETLANEVLAGKWGSGKERKQKLTKAGYDYDKVQAYVNKILALNVIVLNTCEVQAQWMKNYTYSWPKWKPRNVEMSKKYGTCVTYVACVLQRLGYLESGEYIWHNGKGYGTGKVVGTNSKMQVIYMKNKTIASCKSSLRAGDIILLDDNKSGKAGSGGHIFIFSGRWSTKGNPMIWDNRSCNRIKQGKKGRHAYSKDHKILAIVRLKVIQKKSNKGIAKEVIKGKWGSGDERKKKLTQAGYDYKTIQKLVNEIVANPTSDVVSKMNAWAIKTAKQTPQYHYNRWKENDLKTHTCPICKGRKYDDHYGWNCIGWAFAIWHHGGGIKCKCNCHVVADAKRILNAKTDKAAYDEAVKRVGIEDIKVIRNGGKSIKNMLEPGDICWTMSNGKIQHTYYYMGNGKYSDSTSGRSDNIKANMNISSSLLNKTVLAIRYIGK